MFVKVKRLGEEKEDHHQTITSRRADLHDKLLVFLDDIFQGWLVGLNFVVEMSGD